MANKNKHCIQKEWDDEEAARCHLKVVMVRGGSTEGLHGIFQLICEQLVTGTPPNAIPPTIQTFCETILCEKPKELPSVSFVRECCGIIEVIGEIIAAIKLACAPRWDQLWYNGTTCRQILFGALIIGMLAGDDTMIDPVVVLLGIFMEDETSETHAEGIVDKGSVYK